MRGSHVWGERWGGGGLWGGAGGPLGSLRPLAPLPSLGRAEFRAIAAAVPAPTRRRGAHGCGFAHIAGWPDPLLDALADLYRVVDAAWQWPRGVAALPEGGTSDTAVAALWDL